MFFYFIYLYTFILILFYIFYTILQLKIPGGTGVAGSDDISNCQVASTSQHGRLVDAETHA